MAWQSRNNFTPSDYLDAADLNALANDIRAWGNDVNGGGYTLSNVQISGSVTAGMPDPTTTLGDLIVRGTNPPPTRLGIGANGQVLTADSTQPLGMAWKTPAAASPVTSVFGRTGAIVAAAGDYSVNQVTGALPDPTTTKGDLLVHGAIAVNRLGVGVDGQVLMADSTQAVGLKWAASPGQVTTVFGRNGVVTAQAGDYTAAQVTGAVPNTVQVVAGAGMSGGGALTGNVTLNALVTSVFGRTGAVVLTAADISSGGGVPATRQVLAGAGLTGGGNLGTDVTLTAAVTSVFGRSGAVVLTAADVTGVGGVLTSRQVLTGSGLTGGGDLSADRTLSIVPKSVNQLVAVAYAGTVQGTRPTVNFVSSGGVSITVADDSATNSVDVTLGVSSASVGVSVDSNPVLGPRPTLHFISGSNAAISASDNSTNNRVDITVSAAVSGGAGAQTPWVSNIDAASYQLANVSFVGVNRPADSANAHISINSTVSDGLRISNSAASGLAQASLINSDASAKLILMASGSTAATNPSTAEINTAGPLLLATNSLEAMRISTAQRVLVGIKTDDGTHLVQVNGTIKSLTGGYVFPDGTTQTTAAGGGMTDPTTTKGDLIVHGATTTRLGVGADGLVLTADSTQALGIKWAASAGGVASVFGRTGAVVAAAGDYTVGQVTGAVPNTTQVIAGTGLTGGGSLSGNVTLNVNVPSVQTPWLQDVDAASHSLLHLLSLNPSGQRVLLGTATDDGASQVQINTTSANTLSAITTSNQNLASFYCYSGSGQNFGLQVRGYAARGTPASPAALASGDWIEGVLSYGYDGSAWGRGPDILFLADSNWTTSSHGSYMVFGIVPQGATGAPVEAMRITSAGLVGIGNATPSCVLDVAGMVRSTAVGAAPTAGSGIEIYYSPSSGRGVVHAYNYTSSAYLPVYVEGNPVVINSVSGANVGIGTPPAYPLDISYNAGAGSATFSGGVTGIRLNSSGSYSEPRLDFVEQGNSPIAAIAAKNTAGAAGPLIFLTRASGGSLTEKVRIDSAGNVGIGTTTPLGPLDVNVAGSSGWVYFRGNTGAVPNPSASVNSGLMFAWNSSNGNGESVILYGTGVGGAPALLFGRWSGSAKSIDMQLNAGNAYFANGVAVGSSAYFNQAGDLGVSRNSAPTNGVVYFGSGGSHYLFFDGSNWTLAGGGSISLPAVNATGYSAGGVAGITGSWISGGFTWYFTNGLLTKVQ